MVAGLNGSVDDEGALVAEEQGGRSPPRKRTPGKVPKKVHKAEREKLKREHLNELFEELGYALEPGQQNRGKASILSDATQFLRDLLSQVESFRRQNATLVTESQYVTLEKNELIDENLALESEIQKLQIELQEKVQSNPAWTNGVEAADPSVLQATTAASPIQQPAPVVGHVYVIPLNQELPTYPLETTLTPASALNPPSHVTRPHARYPTPSDSWPLQFLSQPDRAVTPDCHHTGGSSSSSSSSNTSTTISSRRGSSVKE